MQRGITRWLNVFMVVVLVIALIKTQDAAFAICLLLVILIDTVEKLPLVKINFINKSSATSAENIDDNEEKSND